MIILDFLKSICKLVLLGTTIIPMFLIAVFCFIADFNNNKNYLFNSLKWYEKMIMKW